MTIRSRALHESRATVPTPSDAIAVTAVRRHLARVLMVAAILVAAGCGRDPQVLPDEAFRNIVPANAELLDEDVDDGSSLTVDGERTVLRTFVPVPPADASEVLSVLVAEGEGDGWLFTERSAALAVGTKEIEGRPWMVSVVVKDDAVEQLFAGR